MGMFKWAFCWLLSGSLAAAEYAVVPAPQGSDGNAGSVSSPFATIRHALSRAGSGDTIHVARGAVYRESADLRFGDGITVRSSGPAERGPAVITTSVLIPELKVGEGKRLTAQVARPVLAVWVDGRYCRSARFPNEGYLRAGEGSTADRLLIRDPATALAGAKVGQWRDAQVRWRRWSWWWETRPITEAASTGLGLGAENRFKDPFTGIGSSFYVDNCLAELDAPGEWFYDRATATLHLIPPPGADDARPRVEVVVDESGFACAGAILEGLSFERIAGNALAINGKATINDCRFQEIEVNAITGSWNAFGTRIQNSLFRDVRNVAIAWNENPAGAGGTVIHGNRLERIGMEFGYGGSGAWHAAGIIISNAKGVTVRENRIVDTGYAGIILGSDGHTVDRNVFVRCMGSLNDGGAIYANCSRSIITNNIILDTVGNLATSHDWYPLGHGIWPEFLSDFREQVITGNTVVGSGGHGLFLTNNYQCTVSGNIFADNRLGAMHLSGHGKTAAQNHRITDNVLAAIAPARRVTYEEHIPGNWSGNDRPRAIDAEGGIDYGRMQGTTIIASPGVPVATIKNGRSYEDAASMAGDHRWADGQARTLRATSLLLINDTTAPHVFPAPRGGWSGLDGKPIGKEIAVEPFTTVVLVRAAAPDGTPPYVLASGIDYRDAQGGLGEPAAIAAVPERRTKARKEPAARPEPITAAAKPEAQQRWLDLLRTRTVTAAASPRPPRFQFSVMRSEVTVVSVDGDMATLDLAGSGAMQANLFGRISSADAFALARVLIQGTADAEGHALAAFYARSQRDQAAYREHLALAGSFAAEIDAAFP